MEVNNGQNVLWEKTMQANNGQDSMEANNGQNQDKTNENGVAENSLCCLRCP